MKTIPLFTALLLLVISCKQKENAENPVRESSNIVSLTNNQISNISLDTAKITGEEENLILTGKVSFDESKVAKVFPLVGGNVTRVLVTLGDYVHKGQLLAVIRSTEISDLQSQYSVAQSALNTAKKNLDIAEELFKTKTYSELQVIAARHDYTSAETEVNRLKQSLAVYGASTTLPDALYDVISPMDGYVVEKNVNEKMDIRPDNGTNIFTVSALNTIWVLADVYESDLAKVSVGQSVGIKTVAYPGIIFKGTISHVDNVLDPESKVAHARIELDNSKGLLRPEMFAEITDHIILPGQEVTVSSKAIVFQGGNNYVLVKKSSTSFEKRQVAVGRTNDSGRTYILNGVRDGEIVVATGSVYVANVE
ncbi:MAG TPA: efflux RND transporter periplasmic adaptor subunit [Bacteroidia bacterium]|nr:efflux RND transporter periplasmic adaptor subunit [Bacteroidia bacterium]